MAGLIKFKNEQEMNKAGIFLAEPDKNLTKEDAATVIRNAIEQGKLSIKRGVEWYWKAGRCLQLVKERKLYGPEGWEAFCRQCGISPSQAWKYKELARRYTLTDLESFANERFSLDRALGYEKETAAGTTDVVTEDQTEPNEYEEAADDEEDEEDDEEEPQEKVATSQKEVKADVSFVEVFLSFPGKYEVICEDDKAVYTLRLDRKDVEKLQRQLCVVMEEDDAIQPDSLPE